MDAYRSRQWSFQNHVVAWMLAACAVISAVAFGLTSAWSDAPWVALGTLALIVALCAIPLTIVVDATSVTISLAGVLRRTIARDSITAIQRREYSPLREFGGWGWRYSLDRRNARAYTTLGSSAVVVTLADGQEVYLGVSDEAALIEALSPSLRP
ncbi:hypothetical protein ON058_07565 [Demequina sp. B12]|uniref:hypothetical protein n=1 Tax=Demequina sp. B12 TaxID=2992757 RepID=UPI00237A8DDB|nr:hypothetical protein [Demequina sp. B12]MDE0573269.1 hypothetical protein [Demequina sp. B12]